MDQTQPFIPREERERERERKRDQRTFRLPTGEGVWHFLQRRLLENLESFSAETKGWVFVSKDGCILRQKNIHIPYINYSLGPKAAR